MKLTFAACALGTLFTTAVFAQPQIFVTFTGAAKVQNNYSNILPGMPSYGIGPASGQDDTANYGAHGDVERLLESSIYDFVEFTWDVVTTISAHK